MSHGQCKASTELKLVGPARCQVSHSPVLQHLPHFPSRAAPALELCVLLWGSDTRAPTAHAVLHDELCGPGHTVGARTHRVNTSAPFSSQSAEALPPLPARRALPRDPQAPRPALLPPSCAAPAPRRRTAPARIGDRDGRPGSGAGMGAGIGGRGRDWGQDQELERCWGQVPPSRRRGAAATPRQPAL